jgi:hypothetical protein
MSFPGFDVCNCLLAWDFLVGVSMPEEVTIGVEDQDLGIGEIKGLDCTFILMQLQRNLTSFCRHVSLVFLANKIIDLHLCLRTLVQVSVFQSQTMFMLL